MKIHLNRLAASALIALIICLTASITGFEGKCQDLRDNVLRLHIIANSDSETDQALKLKVRDALINSKVVDFDSCTNLSEAKEKAKAELKTITEIAQNEISKNGFNYNVEVLVDKSYFETRVYDNFTLPAGEYDSVIVKIGEAKGKNWWCVMFPSLCLPAADCEELNNYVEKDSAEVALKPKKYKIRFKTVEIYHNIKKFLSKT